MNYASIQFYRIQPALQVSTKAFEELCTVGIEMENLHNPTEFSVSSSLCNFAFQYQKAQKLKEKQA